MYRLVAIDVDGTLVNDEKNLTQRTIETIKKAVENNTRVVVSSARSFYRLKGYLEQLGLIEDNQYTISFNGAVIVENKSQKLLSSINFQEKEVLGLIEMAKSFKTPISLYAMNCLITEEIPEILKNNKHFSNVNFRISKFEEIDFNKECIYKIVFVNEPENIMKIKRELSKELYEKYEITSSVPEYIEFVKKGITKSKALDFICKKCNIKKSEVIAIGDADNDLEMINFAGLGVAMENATDSLKEKADYVTSSNNHDGVAKVIERYILRNSDKR